MRYAICNEVYVDWSLEDAFRHAANCGYEGIEIAPFTIANDVRTVDEKTRTGIRNLAEKHGLEIVGLHWLLAKTAGYHITHSDPKIRLATLDYFRELASFCHDIGGKIMVLGSPAQRNLAEGVSGDEGFAFASEMLKQLAPTLEQLDITLALEPLGPEEGNFLLTAESGIELAKSTGSEHVRLHLDVKAMSTEAKSIPQIILDSKDWLCHFHANDPNRQGPGMGEVPFEPIYTALRKAQYTDWVSVEVFDYSPGIDALTDGSLQYLRRIESETETK